MCQKEAELGSSKFIDIEYFIIIKHTSWNMHYSHKTLITKQIATIPYTSIKYTALK